MKIQHSIPLLAAALLQPSPLHATVDSCVTGLNLTIRMQGDITTKGDVEKGKVDVVRLGAKQILELISDALEIKFPAGSCLFVTVDGDVLVIDKDGEEIVDVSEYVTTSIDFEDYLFKGTYNPETGQENATYYFPLNVELDIPSGTKTLVDGEGLFLELRGTAKEKFTASAPKSDGSQTLRGTISSELDGEGSMDGELLFVQGSTTLKGNEKVEGMEP